MILLLTACTMQPGTGYASLDEVLLDVAFDPTEARDLGDGLVLTDTGARVQFQVLELDVAELRVEELIGGVTFSEQDPPDGYSLCHNGHCHADDGELVDYATIEAEIGGGSFETALSWPIDGTIDALAGETLTLSSCPQDLPELSLRRLSIDVTELRFEGTVDGQELWASMSGDALGPFTLDVDRSAPEAFSLDAALIFDGTGFDGQDPPITLPLPIPTMELR
ncbi:MAG TPA: hypothetical protein QGF58_25110 [Myxococcota bacterium]|nr:hypothetical protein [Myxococcota bacterium]